MKYIVFLDIDERSAPSLQDIEEQLAEISGVQTVRMGLFGDRATVEATGNETAVISSINQVIPSAKVFRDADLALL